MHVLGKLRDTEMSRSSENRKELERVSLKTELAFHYFSDVLQVLAKFDN